MHHRVVPFAAVLMLAGAVPAVADSAPPPAVYVTSADSGTIAVFRLGPGGTITFAGKTEPAKPPQDLRGIVVSPDGRTVYATDNGGNHVLAYRVGADGLLTTISDVPSRGKSPFGIAVAPDGSAVYTADIDSDKVTRFEVEPDGSLGTQTLVSTGAHHPRGVAVSPDGRFIYVSHGTPMPGPAEPGVLTTIAVRPDGTLGPGTDPISIGLAGAMIAIRRDGRFLYVGAQGSNQVFGFRIGAYGELTAVPGSPVPSVAIPEGITVTPDGNRVYTADESDEGDGNVRGFAVGSDGSLTEFLNPPFEEHHSHVGIASTPGGYVYSSDGTDNTLSGFRTDGSGTAHPVVGSPAPTSGEGSAFQSVAVSPLAG